MWAMGCRERLRVCPTVGTVVEEEIDVFSDATPTCGRKTHALLEAVGIARHQLEGRWGKVFTPNTFGTCVTLLGAHATLMQAPRRGCGLARFLESITESGSMAGCYYGG